MPRLRLLVVVILHLFHIKSVTAQYVQSSLPISDTTATGVDLQAHDVAMDADGSTAVAGYPNNNNSSGGFVVYERNGSNWIETFSYYNTGTERNMGAFVVISGDGNTIVVTGANKLYWIYVRQGNTWLLQHKSTTLHAGLEPTISHNGNTLLLGSQIWVRSNNQWTFEANVYQGPSVTGNSGKLSADGNTAVLNRYVSVRQGNSWVQQSAQLVPHLPQNPTYVPTGYYHTLISADGNTYVQGFSYSSSYYVAVFKRTGNIWIQETLLNNTYPGGSDMVLSSNGNNLLFVSAGSGKTYLRFWKRTQSTWSAGVVSFGDTIQTAYNNVINMRAGMDSAGTQVLIANRFSDSFFGGLRYYTLSGSNWQKQGSGLFNNQVKGYSWQGTDVAISLDGSTMVSTGIKNGYGVVWTYTRNGNKWVPQGQPVICPEPANQDRFFAQSQGGRCVTLSANGNTMAVTAIYDETPPALGGQYATTKGAVYMFNRTGGVWQFTQKLTVPYDSNFIALDGGFVRLSNDGQTLIVSSYNKGAFIFAHNGTTWQLQQMFPSISNAYTSQADISGDGNTALLVQKTSFTAGKVYVYKRTGSTWQLSQGPITLPNTSQPNLFPVRTVLSNDGSTFATSDIYSYPDKVYFFRDSAGTFINYGNTCDSTCGGYNINGAGAFGLSTTGDTAYVIVTTNLSTLTLGVDVYVKRGSKWVYVYTGLPDEDMVLPIYGNYVPDASVAVSGDLKYMALGYPYRGGGEGGAYPFVFSSLNVKDSITKASCPSIANGKIKLTITGGVAPVTIAWSTGATGVDSITNLAAGTYTVTITDADGVELVRQYVVSAVKTMLTQNITTNYKCNANTGDVAVTVSGGNTPYSFSWNTNPVQTNDTAFNLAVGTYTYTVTDSVGCTHTDSTTLNINAYWSNITANNPDCVNSNGTAFMQVYGGIPPYSYTWNSGDTTATVNNLAPGSYQVTATDGNGCTVADSITLTPTCANIVQGHLFFDTNNNCVQDSGEVDAANYNLYADGLTYYTYGNTDAQGNYSIQVPTPGSFLVKIGNWSNCSFNVCSGGTNPVPVTFAAIGDTATGVNFALVDTTYDLTVAIVAPPFNPGFAGSVDLVYYNGKGSVVPNGVVTVVYDSLITVNSSVPVFTTHNTVTRTLTFNVGNVGPVDTGQHILLNVTPAPGFTTRKIQCSITPTQNDCNTYNNQFTWFMPLIGAIDPNAKESSTDGRIGFADTAIDYTIHFQNTGNDTTHFIIVTDTLPDFLDPASVQTMATSHVPYTYSLSGEGIVQWRFDPIYLPDSTTDEPNSHGYVTFRVRVADNPAVNTTLRNKAFIVFDYNDAIVTNTTADTVVCKVNGATKQVSICTNQTYNFNGRILTTAGTYKTAYRSKFNCDSIVTLVLTVSNSGNPSLQVDAATCKGQPYLFYGNVLSATGTYTASLPSVTGCDTIVTLNLQVYDTAGAVINTSICKGETYVFDGVNLNSSGTYLKYLQGSNCDSVVTLNLQVHDTSAPGIVNAAICGGESYVFDGNNLTTAGTYTMHLQNGNGCDSTVVLALSVNSVTVTATLSNDTLYAAGAANYTWINCNTGSTVATGNSYKPMVSGTYAAIAEASNCTDTSNCVEVLISGIVETTPGIISVFPNPFSNSTTITVGADIPQYDIQLYDLTGRILAMHTNQTARSFTLNRNNTAAGAYLLKVVSNGMPIATTRLIVE